MGAYTNPNFRCANDNGAGGVCNCFVSDHGWKDERTDEDKLAGATHDNEANRGACHINGCKEYIDGGTEDVLTAAEAAAARDAAKKAAAAPKPVI